MRHLSWNHNDVPFQQLSFLATNDFFGAHLARGNSPSAQHAPTGDKSRGAFQDMEDICISLMHFYFSCRFAPARLDLELVGEEQRPALGECRRHRLMTNVNDTGRLRVSFAASDKQAAHKKSKETNPLHATRSVVSTTTLYNANFSPCRKPCEGQAPAYSRLFSLALVWAMCVIEITVTI